MELDVTDVLSAVRVPTLVLSKERRRDSAHTLPSRIPDARMVDLPGEGLAIFEHDGVYAAEAIEAFLGGEPPAEVPDTVLATILFTDLVGSTERAAELGDRAWRELLAKHHELVRRELARFRGEEQDTAGDGFFATFDGPARAIRAAQAIVARRARARPRDPCGRAHRRMRGARRQGRGDRGLDGCAGPAAAAARRGSRLRDREGPRRRARGSSSRTAARTS